MDDRCAAARRMIAQGPMCTVEECRCGVLHVSLGPFTFRVQREAVASIWETLGDALARLSKPRSDHSALRDFVRRAERPS